MAKARASGVKWEVRVVVSMTVSRFAWQPNRDHTCASSCINKIQKHGKLQ